MKKLLILVLLSGFCFTQVSAQKGLPKLNRKAMVDSLSPEQRKEMRKIMRAKYDSLSPEKKAALRERILSRADSLNPKQKARLRKRLQNNTPANKG
ncbi:MAG: DUF3106 domain-containing protein [Bacteroidota bacterium]